MLKKCHSDHMKIGPNMIKVTLKLNADEMYVVYHLATKYADGKPCLAEFLKTMALTAIKDNFTSELKQDIEANK